MERGIWLWRLRKNPLRRRSYAVEAWAFLAAALAALVVAVLVGVSTAHGLQREYAQQRLDRHSTSAVLTQKAPDGYRLSRVDVPAQWKAPDGTVLTGIVTASPGTSRGAVVPVWTNSQGVEVAQPLSPSSGEFQADVIGAGAAFAICVGVLIGCGITTKLLDHRRCARWDAEWTEADSRWGHHSV
ncbi:hypothetical protein ACIQCJ_25935 [Streptomyces sp. NPDC093221]|uniref:Rv1733c family protein n=1 Tax=Streptomyces sp. NPDC093221 TaxID=3366032 RepID=UPI0037F15AAF